MVVALVIVAIILYILNSAQGHIKFYAQDRTFKNLLIVTLILTLIQVIAGTQVRQFTDEQVKMLGYENMHMVLQQPEFSFYFHRTFSIVVAMANLWLYFRNKKLKLGYYKLNWVLWLLALEIASGIAMYYFDFPFGSQSLHLIVASLLFGVQFYLILENIRKPKATLA